MKQVEPSNTAEQTAPQAVSFGFENKSAPAKKVLASWLGRSYLTLLFLGAGLVILYWVIFMLPASVTEADIPVEPSIIAKTAQQPLKQSPWRDAQLAKHRRDSQEVLSKVLEKQKLLEDKHVELWASSQFAEAIKSAESGDLLYRSQEFAMAIQSYDQALEQLITLETTIPAIFNSYLEQGQLALAAHNSQKAKQQLTIALYLQPNDPIAAVAFDRAIVLDQVMQLVKAGIVLVDEQQLEAAKLKFSQAFALDNHSTIVNRQLARVNESIKQRDYSIAMSDGYNSMNNLQYQQAIKHFRIAQKIAPGASDPKQAIRQSKNQQTRSNIALNIKQAQALEHREAWAAANLKYRQALLMDKTLMAARLGELRTQARKDLNQKLTDIIDKPQRLTNEDVYRQALLVYNDALKTKQPGDKLSRQLVQVKQLLAEVKIPVSLRIESDNRTRVTLYRVGELGNFTAKDLILKPGEYTIVGSRDGYRDVRQQFTLLPNSRLKTIIVQCEQKVTNG